MAVPGPVKCELGLTLTTGAALICSHLLHRTPLVPIGPLHRAAELAGYRRQVGRHYANKTLGSKVTIKQSTVTSLIMSLMHILDEKYG